MRVKLLIASAIFSLATMYIVGWFVLWLIDPKKYELWFNFKYFFSGTIVILGLCAIGAFGVMALCSLEEWFEERCSK